MRAAAGALIAAALLAGCGAGDGEKRSPAAPPAEAAGPPPGSLQAADCSDWLRVGDQGRRTLLGELRASRQTGVSGRGYRGQGSVLSDEQATRLFNARCAEPWAKRLRLYKMYAFAAGFVGGR
jgi:hypothetical protein